MLFNKPVRMFNVYFYFKYYIINDFYLKSCQDLIVDVKRVSDNNLVFSCDFDKC